MATIRIKTRASSRAGGGAAYYLQIIHRRRVRLISTGIRCGAAQGLPPGVDEFARPYRLAVAELDSLGSPYTLDDIVRAAARSRCSVELTAYIEGRVNELLARGRTGTAGKYKSLSSHLARFLGGSTWPVALTDRGRLLRFAQYLKDTGMTRNTLSSYMRPLAAVLRRACGDGLVDYDPAWFEGIYRGVDKTAKRAISLAEMQRIAALRLDGSPELELARDLFVFSFYTMGMPFVDVVRLTRRNIRGNELVYRRAKTGQALTVPLNRQAMAIIARYAGAPDGYIFPVLGRGARYESALRVHNRRLKRVGEMAGCAVPLTSYIGRHTWATVARDSGVALPLISAALGHTSEQTTRIYLASVDTSALRAANDRLASLLDPAATDIP